MSRTPMSSEEKDPTCVVKMLDCLKPANQRISGFGRPMGARRGASVATRLEFGECLTIERPSSYSNRKRILEYDVTLRTVEKKFKEDNSDLPIPESPWEKRLMQADLIKAKAQIEVLQNLNKEHHRLRKEQEQVFDNEKSALQQELDGANLMVSKYEDRLEVLAQRNSTLKNDSCELKARLASQKLESSDRIRALERLNSELRDELGGAQLAVQKAGVAERWRITQLEAELVAAMESADDQQKRTAELLDKLQEANQNNLKVEVLELQLLDARNRIASLESEQEANKEAVALAKLQQQKLLAYPELERDLERLKDDNAKLRGLVHNKLLLEEQVSSLEARLATSEQRDRDLAQLRALHDVAQRSLDEWVSLARELGTERPAALRQRFDQLLQRELQLTAEVGEFKSRLRMSVEAKNSTTADLESLKQQMEKLRSLSDVQKAHMHRVNKKLQLVTMERNSYRSQLDCYERDLTMPSTAALVHSQHEQQRARIEALEKALEGYRELVDSDNAKSRPEATAGENSEMAMKVGQLEGEKAALQSANVRLQRRLEELELELQFRALKGDFNPMKSKVMHCRLNPQSEAESLRGDELSLVQAECARLRERVRVLQEGQGEEADITLITDERLRTTNSQEVLELRSQLASCDTKIRRLKEAFRVTSNDFREIVYMVLGYRIDRKNSNEYNLSSMYAESPDDILTFKYNSASESVEMMETPFSNTLTSLIDLHLRRQHSIPVFLSAVTVDLFSQSTASTVTEPSNFS